MVRLTIARITEVEAWSPAVTGGTTPNIQWLVTDHLGTPRLVFDKTGSVASTKRHDYLPFGEELTSQGLRDPAHGYGGGDGVRQKYTSYERDDETGLDYAHARYYGNVQGRFTSPDPFSGSATIADPQTFNRYAYVGNNPVTLSDPTGMFVESNTNPHSANTFFSSVDDSVGSQIPGHGNRNQFVHEAIPAAGTTGLAAGLIPGAAAGASPQNPSQTPTPTPPCSEQDFNFSDGSGNYSARDLSAIAQTAVGEASNAFYPNEVEAVIGTIVNRQNLNIAAYPQRGDFARGQAVIFTPGNLRGGILGEYDAHRFGSGTTKLNGAKVNGVLPASSYVCDQLKAAKDFSVRSGNMSPADMRTPYPYTSNRRIGARLPAGATGVTTIGNTRFFVDRGVRWPF